MDASFSMKMTLVFLLTAMVFPGIAQENKIIEIKEIERDGHLHTSFRKIEGYGLVDSNGLIVIDGHQAYIIDTPWSEADTRITSILDSGKGL